MRVYVPHVVVCAREQVHVSSFQIDLPLESRIVKPLLDYCSSVPFS